MDNIVEPTKYQPKQKQVFGATDATQRARIFGSEEPEQSNGLTSVAAVALTTFKNQLIDAMAKQIEKFKQDDLSEIIADYPEEHYDKDKDDQEARMKDIQDAIYEQFTEDMYEAIYQQSPH